MYRPPVDAPVVDPFRPPPEPWLAGNRGLEYATAPGTPVRAIGPGVVVFAGPVAGALYATILHPDGLRSSYSYLAAILVRVGDRVAGGDPVGTAGPMFHLGVRQGDAYIDPASLWGRRVTGGVVYLVPTGRAGSAAGGARRGAPTRRAGDSRADDGRGGGAEPEGRRTGRRRRRVGPEPLDPIGPTARALLASLLPWTPPALGGRAARAAVARRQVPPSVGAPVGP